MSKVYVLFYKNKRKVINLHTLRLRIFDNLTRFFTRGKYTHCEIAIRNNSRLNIFKCFSSSVQDKGIRMKTMYIDPNKWDIVPINMNSKHIYKYFHKTKGLKYDFLGALGLVLPVKDDRNKLFCSEFCFNCIFRSDKGWRFSPNDLYAILRK